MVLQTGCFSRYCCFKWKNDRIPWGESEKSAFNDHFCLVEWSEPEWNIAASAAAAAAAAPVGWEGLLSHDRLFQSRPAETQLFSAAGPPPPLSAVMGICGDDVSLQGTRAEHSILIQVTYQSFTFSQQKCVYYCSFLNERDIYRPPGLELQPDMMLS